MLLNYALVHRRLERVVPVEPSSTVPWKSQRLTMKVACGPRGFLQARPEPNVTWNGRR